jgi:hypothetical protein
MRKIRIKGAAGFRGPARDETTLGHRRRSPRFGHPPRWLRVETGDTFWYASQSRPGAENRNPKRLSRRDAENEGKKEFAEGLTNRSGLLPLALT